MLHQAQGNNLCCNRLIKALQSEVKYVCDKIQGSLPGLHALILVEVGSSQPQPVLSKPSGKVSPYSVPGGPHQKKEKKKRESK